MSRVLTTSEWLTEWRVAGASPTVMARNTGISLRNINARREKLTGQGYDLKTNAEPKYSWAYPRIQRYDFEDGIGIFYADPHNWPGTPPTVAYNALLRLCERLKPKIVVANGDLIDGASIKRFPNQGWEKLPSVADEIACTQERQREIKKAAGDAITARTIGNHDLRFDRFLNAQAESFDGLKGFRLSDHLPDWPGSWGIQVNDTVIKHRNKGGIHASRNNVLQAGVNIVTAHLHTIGCSLVRGYRKRPIWGIQIPTLSEPAWDGPDEGVGPFEYSEDNPTDWVSGFAVLTYKGGHLSPPEFCQVVEGEAWFRGSIVA